MCCRNNSFIFISYIKRRKDMKKIILLIVCISYVSVSLQLKKHMNENHEKVFTSYQVDYDDENIPELVNL
jgi:hypothetical protein